MAILGGITLDLTQVFVTLITTIPAILAAVWARNVVKQVRTPSGDTLGAVAERTHDLAAVNTRKLQQMHTAILNGRPVPGAEPEHEAGAA